MPSNPQMRRRNRFFLPRIALTTLSAVVFVPSAFAADNLAAIQLDAQPPVLRADGRSTTIISAQVYDDKGNIAADGTKVRFTTTAGHLDAPDALTRNGVARVTLTSSDQPGNAIIIAVLDSPGKAVPARITVAFTNDAEVTDTRTAYIRINGAQYIGYAANKGVIQANGKNGGASISYRGTSVQADVLQFNVKSNLIKAIGNVRLTVNGHEQLFDHLLLALFDRTGTAERIVDNHVQAFELTGQTLESTAYPEGRFPPSSQQWVLEDISDSGITVVARSIMIEPGKRLQFRRATFYVDGSKAFSTPLHVMTLGQDSIFPEQVIGYGQEGFMVDFPFYYQADPNGIGTLNLRRAARVSSSAYSVRPGWSLDLTQNYNGINNQAGTFEVYGMSRPDWGMRLRHAQRLATDTTGNFYLDFPNHRSLFMNSQATRSFKTFSLNTLLSGSRSPGYKDVTTNQTSPTSGDIREQVYAETYDRSFLKSKVVHYTLNTGASQQNLYGQLVIPGQPAPPNNIRTQSVQGRFFTTPLPLAKQTSLRQSVSIGQTWVQGGGKFGYGQSGMTLLGTTSLNRRLGNLGSTDISYDYAQTPLSSGINAASVNGRHRLSMNAFLGGNRWDVSLNGSQGLDSPQTSMVGTFQMNLGGLWRGRVVGSLSRFSGVAYHEVEYALIRRIAGRDFALYYSTTSRRFQLDLTGARF